jgi:hypothetical protein
MRGTMMSDLKKPRKQRKSSGPLQIADLELNKETVADLTDAEAEHVKGGLMAGEEDAGLDQGRISMLLTLCGCRLTQLCP